MNVIDIVATNSVVKFDLEEVFILNAALNEVCNGIEIFEFETRMGANHERVRALMVEIAALLARVG